MPRDIRARLEVSARQLREGGHDDSAVQALLAPRGWVLLRDSQPDATSSGTSRTLGIYVTPALRDALKAAVEQTDTTLGVVATDGLDRYVKGDWEPDAPVRTPGVKKVNLSMRVDAAIADRAAERAAADSERLGYRLTVAWVIQSWLVGEFDLHDVTSDD